MFDNQHLVINNRKCFVMKFDEKYCFGFCKKYGITPLSNQSKWHPYRFSFNFENINLDNSTTLFSNGIGINETPHLLTTLQLFAIAKLAERGCSTQIILGDFDVALARCFNPQSSLIESYIEFCKSLGYKQDVVLQSKISNRLENLVEISRYIQMLDFSFVREDILDYYDVADSFSLLFSYLLIFSDLLMPIMTGKYNNVVMCCGLDESRYAIVANRILNRMGINGQIGGLYTFVPNNGINGWPQMSKSHPDSAIFLSDTKETISCKLSNNIELSSSLYKAFLSDNWNSNNNIQTTSIIDYINLLADKWKK